MLPLIDHNLSRFLKSEAENNTSSFICCDNLRIYFLSYLNFERFCGLVVRVAGYRSRGLGSIHGATRFFENGVHDVLEYN
jgi:hypothetical protein